LLRCCLTTLRFSCGRKARSFRILRSTAGRSPGLHGHEPVRAPASRNRLLGSNRRRRFWPHREIYLCPKRAAVLQPDRVLKGLNPETSDSKCVSPGRQGPEHATASTPTADARTNQKRWLQPSNRNGAIVAPLALAGDQLKLKSAQRVAGITWHGVGHPLKPDAWATLAIGGEQSEEQ
jgi:hypothetical protein